MNRMKRWLAVLLSVALLAAPCLQGCGEKPATAETHKIELFVHGSLWDTVSAKAGETIEVPAPEETGWVFGGWYENENLTGSTVTPPTAMPDKDTVLYGKYWKEAPTTIRFETNGGQAIADSTAHAGDLYILPTPTRTGYVFEGWCKDEALTQSFTDKYVGESDVTLYAKWKKDTTKVLVSFQLMDGTEFASQAIPLTDGVGKATQPAWPYAQYALSGYLRAGKPFNFGQAISEDTVLVANYYSKGFEIENGTLVSFSGNSEVVIVPSQLDGETVTAIGEGCFLDVPKNTKITKIVIPEGVTAIGDNAFAGLKDLTDVNFPTTLTDIGDDIFYECDSLRTVDFAGNDDLVVKDGAVLSKDGKQILLFIGSADTYTTPAGVTTIRSGAFSYANVKKVVLGADVTTLEIGAFLKSFAVEVTLSDKVTLIPQNAFAGSNLLTKVTFGAGVARIAREAFADCKSLAEVNFTKALTVEAYAFKNCEKLTEFDFAKATLENGTAFAGASIANFTLPAGTMAVAENYFLNWRGLTSISIPASVTEIGSKAFSGCDKLTTVEFAANSQLATIGDGAFGGTALTVLDLTPLTKLTTIGAEAFRSCKSLTSLTVPNSVQRMGLSMLADCSKLSQLSIPFAGQYGYEGFKDYFIEYVYQYIKKNSGIEWDRKNQAMALSILNDIGKQWYLAIQSEEEYVAFASRNCYGSFGLLGFLFGTDAYENSTVANQHLDSEYYTYYLPSDLKNVTITGSFVSAWSMNGTKSIESVTFGAGLKTIGDYAFYNSLGLVNCDLQTASGLKTIGKASFMNCNEMLSIKLPDGLTSIGESAFDYCNKLAEVRLPAGPEKCEIDYKAFAHCNLSTAYTNADARTENVVKIDYAVLGEYSFLGLAATAVELGDNVEFRAREIIMDLKPAYVSCGTFLDSVSLESIKLPNEMICHYTPSNGDPADVETPNYYYTPNMIPTNFLYGCTSLRKINPSATADVNLPEGIEAIGNNSFRGTAITNMTIPAAVRYIYYGAFNRTALEELDLSNIINFGTCVTGCEKLKTVIVNNQNERFYRSAFEGCTSLDTMKVKEDGQFVEGKNEEGVIHLPEALRLESTDWYMFKQTGVKKVILEDAIHISYLPSQMFYECAQLEEVHIPAAVKQMAGQVFYGNTSLKKVTFDSGVTQMGYSCFEKCSSLTSMEFPEGLRFVDSSILANCANLQRVVLPTTMYSFSKQEAFRDCPKLTEIVLLGTTPANVDGALPNPGATSTFKGGMFYNSSVKDVYSVAELKARGLKIYVPAESRAAYEEHCGVSVTGATPGFTKINWGWHVYKSLFETFESGLFVNGSDSVQLRTVGEKAYLSVNGGNYEEATVAQNTYKVAAGSYTLDAEARTMTAAGGKTFRKITGTYIDDSYNTNNEGATDRDDPRMIQFRPQLTLHADGRAQFYYFVDKTADSKTKTDYALTAFMGSYTLQADGSIVVTLNKRISLGEDVGKLVEIENDMETPYTFTIQNGTGTFVYATETTITVTQR